MDGLIIMAKLTGIWPEEKNSKFVSFSARFQKQNWRITNIQGGTVQFLHLDLIHNLQGKTLFVTTHQIFGLKLKYWTYYKFEKHLILRFKLLVCKNHKSCVTLTSPNLKVILFSGFSRQKTGSHVPLLIPYP